MIDPTALRVVGTIDENKGLSAIKVGAPVSFTVDAFGNKSFTGIVDEISPTANDTSVVFSISDQRPTNRFDVKVRYDVAAHPEFKNGMSAKMWVYPK
jgi:multidrug resistance efflux pump